MKIRKGKFTGHFFTNTPVSPDIAHRIRGYFPILEAQMDTTNQTFATRSQIYTDGVVILYSIIKNGPVPIYKVNVSTPYTTLAGILPFSLSLESGLYFVNRLNEEAAHWSIGDDIRNATVPLGEIVLDPLSGSVPLSSFENTTIESLQLSSSTRKEVQLFYPASMYSGKLRFFIQAVYGSPRTDYSTSSSNLSISGHSLKHSGTTGTVLYKTADYSYYILDVSTSGITVYETLPLNTEASTIIDAIKLILAGTLTTDEESIYEGILLSLLAINPTAIDTASFTISLDDSVPLGEPFAYSWKADSTGENVSAVFLYIDSCAEAIKSRTVHLAIDLTDGVWTVTPTTEDQIAGEVNTAVFAWRPVSNLIAISELVTYLCPASGGCTPEITGASQEFSNLPIYGRYNDEDAWEALTITREYLTTADNVPLTSPRPLCGFGSRTDILRTYGGTGMTRVTWQLATNSFVGRTSNAGSSGLSFADYDYSLEYAGDDIFSSQIKYVDPTSCLGQTHSFNRESVVCVIAETGRAKQYRYLGNYFDDVGGSSLVIPHGDCEAMLLLTKKKDRTGSTAFVLDLYKEQGLFDGTLSPIFSWYQQVSDGLGGFYDCDVQMGNLIFDSWTRNRAFSDIGFPSSIRQRFTFTGLETITVDLVEKTGITSITNSAGATTASVYDYSIGSSIPYPTFTDEEEAKLLNNEWGAMLVAYGENQSTFSDPAGWGDFLVAPTGICSTGNRYLEKVPDVKQSAVWNSLLLPTSSSISAQESTAGYEESSAGAGLFDKASFVGIS